MKIFYGSTRWVLVTTKWSFKFPSFYGWYYFLAGLINNHREYVYYQDKKYIELCPIIFYVIGGFLTVMPTVKELTDKNWVEFNFKKFTARGGRLYQIAVENKKDSFGWLNGRVVAIDYGQLHDYRNHEQAKIW